MFQVKVYTAFLWLELIPAVLEAVYGFSHYLNLSLFKQWQESKFHSLLVPTFSLEYSFLILRHEQHLKFPRKV